MEMQVFMTKSTIGHYFPIVLEVEKGIVKLMELNFPHFFFFFFSLSSPLLIFFIKLDYIFLSYSSKNKQGRLTFF